MKTIPIPFLLVLLAVLASVECVVVSSTVMRIYPYTVCAVILIKAFYLAYELETSFERNQCGYVVSESDWRSVKFFPFCLVPFFMALVRIAFHWPVLVTVALLMLFNLAVGFLVLPTNEEGAAVTEPVRVMRVRSMMRSYVFIFLMADISLVLMVCLC